MLLPLSRWTFRPSWIKILAIIFVLLQVDEFFFNTFFEWLQPADLWLLLFLSRLDDLRSGISLLASIGQDRATADQVGGVGITGTVFGTQFVDLVLPQLPLPHLALAFIGNTLYYLSLLLIPLSIGMAILRYRLWDIDTLINCTLVYGTLTGLVIVRAIRTDRRLPQRVAAYEWQPGTLPDCHRRDSCALPAAA